MAWREWGSLAGLLVGDVFMGKALTAVDPCLPARHLPAGPGLWFPLSLSASLAPTQAEPWPHSVMMRDESLM